MQCQIKEPFIKCANTIGESIHYEPTNNALTWLDIAKNELHAVNLDKGSSSHRVTPDLATRPHKTVDLVHDAGLWLVGGKHGVGLMDKVTGKSRYIARFPDDEDRVQGQISNDGAVDSAGRFWAGTMADPMDFTKFDGSLWRFDADLKVTEVIKGGVGIANGVSWSKDDTTMYWTDSTRMKIFAYDFDAKAGTISNERTFYEGTRTDSGLEVPDGHAMDVDGFIWVAIYGGSKVVRLSPAGKVVGEISLPTSNITDVAFVKNELFITSARNENQPETSGHLYRCDVGIGGQPLNKFALSKEFLASMDAKL